MTKIPSSMNWTLGAAVFLTFLVSLNVHGAAVSETPSVAAILKRMAAAYQSLESLAAELEQIKSYPQLGLDDPPETGLLYVKRKRPDELMVRLEIQKPEQRIVTVKDDGSYVLYQPRIKQAIEGRVNKKAGGGSGTSFMSYFLGDLSNAQKDYDIVYLGEEVLEEQHDTLHLRLTAKPTGEGYYRTIDLWVDQKHWIPVQQELVEPNRSVTKLQFRAFRINEEIEDSAFTVKLPPDVERVRG